MCETLMDGINQSELDEINDIGNNHEINLSFKIDLEIKRAKDLLCGTKRLKIKIPSSDIGREDANLPEGIDPRFNVYAIWSDDSLMYIGKAKDIKQRLRQHLFSCSDKTNSKLDEVEKEQEAGKEISISLIEVIPGTFREAIEESLIRKITEADKTALPWNEHERAKS